MNLYLDTSAIVKRYVMEPGTPDVQGWIEAADALIVCAIGRAETTAAIARIVRKGIIARETAWKSVLRFRADWASFQRVPVTDALVARADDLAWQLDLRGYDATHLAAALTWQDHLRAPITLATYDSELWKAAQASGLQVLPEKID
jgi:predicted nucleic acid-binding protein